MMKWENARRNENSRIEKEPNENNWKWDRETEREQTEKKSYSKSLHREAEKRNESTMAMTTMMTPVGRSNIHCKPKQQKSEQRARVMWIRCVHSFSFSFHKTKIKPADIEQTSARNSQRIKRSAKNRFLRCFPFHSLSIRNFCYSFYSSSSFLCHSFSNWRCIFHRFDYRVNWTWKCDYKLNFNFTFFFSCSFSFCRSCMRILCASARALLVSMKQWNQMWRSLR